MCPFQILQSSISSLLPSPSNQQVVITVCNVKYNASQQHHEEPQYKVPPPVEIEGSPTGYFVHYQDGSEGRGKHPHYHPHHHHDNQRSPQLTTLPTIKMVPIDLKGGKGWAGESKPQIT